MILNQFIDTGADNATVNDMKKSIAREDDLQKAMNKAGLVQKEVQVKGKNGQIFTRKQWVKASDAQNTANNSPQQSIGNNSSQMSQKDESKSPKAISVSSFNGKSYTEIVKLLDDAPPGTKISGIIDPGGQKRFNHNRDVVIEKHSGYVANYSVGAKSKETWWEFNGSKKPDVAGEILDIVKGKSKYYQVRNDDSQLTKLGGRFKREDFKLPKSGNRGNADELLSMVNKLDESCSVVGIRPEIITGHGTFTVKTYKITGKPGSELEVRYGSDAQGVYFIADGEKYRDVNSLVEHIKSSGSTTDKSSSTSKKANKNTNLTSKISGIPEFRDIKYDNKSNFTFTDKDGNKVSGKTVDARTLKPGDTVLLYNGTHVQAIGTVTDTSVETLDSRSIHSRKAVSITIETADGKSLGGFSDSEPDFSVRKITKVEDAISGQSKSKSDDKASSGKFKPSDFQFRSGGQVVADFVNSIDKELGVKKHANGNVGFGTLSLENGASVNFGYDDTGAYATWNGSKFRDAKSLKSAMSGQKNGQGKMNHQTGVREEKAATMIEDYFAGNHSHDDGKKALANLLGKGYTRDDIMAQAEKSGVTWKKNDHAGINWMRASMAIQKHLNNSSK